MILANKFAWPPLSDRCQAQEWIASHVPYVDEDMIEVHRWRFPDGSVIDSRHGTLYAVRSGVEADEIVRTRALRRARVRRFRVWWQRRPVCGDHRARMQVREWRRRHAAELRAIEGAWL